jgi:hypothetical protein
MSELTLQDNAERAQQDKGSPENYFDGANTAKISEYFFNRRDGFLTLSFLSDKFNVMIGETLLSTMPRKGDQL